MVAYIVATTKSSPKDVTIADIATEPVAKAFMEYGESHTNLRYYCRKIFRLMGHPHLIPMMTQVYPQAHPLVDEWVKTDGLPKDKQITARTTCMGLLTWLVKSEVFPYGLESFPLLYLRRTHLLSYRQHLVKSARRGRRTYDTARWHMQLVVRWVRWLIESKHIGPLNVDRLAIKTDTGRTRRIPTYTQITKFIEAMFTTPIDEAYKLFFLLLLSTGAGPIEIRHLTMNHVDTVQHALWLQSEGVQVGGWSYPNTYGRGWSNTFTLKGGTKAILGLMFLSVKTGAPSTFEYCTNVIRIAKEQHESISMESCRPATDLRRIATKTRVSVQIFQYVMSPRTFRNETIPTYKCVQSKTRCTKGI